MLHRVVPTGRHSSSSSTATPSSSSTIVPHAMQIAEHAAYLEEVSVTACPKLLPALLQVRSCH